MAAARAAMAAGDVPGPGMTAPPAATSQPPGDGSPATASKIVCPTGFRLSPYAETGPPGAAMKDPPRKLWHASPGSQGSSGSSGSAGGWADPG
ncbi:MAG TPA: hypothetical protein VGI74_06225 [Streptosporangiaceae bacterium]